MIQGCIRTGNTISIVANNKNYLVDFSHPNFALIAAKVDSGELEDVVPLLDVAKAIKRVSRGDIVVENDTVLYKGQVIHSVLTERMLQLMRAGQDFSRLVNFLNNLMENPSKRAVEELYTFLEHKNLPLTDDGCFLAYKSVRLDYTDFHSGSVDNHIGAVPTMPRNFVDDDKDRGCSHGYHVGSIEYVRSFGGALENKHIMIVKTNPRDVVSVPVDCNCQKVRTCRYEVISEYEGDLPEVLPGFVDPDNSDDDWDNEHDSSEDICRCTNCGLELMRKELSSDEFDSLSDYDFFLCDTCYIDEEVQNEEHPSAEDKFDEADYFDWSEVK